MAVGYVQATVSGDASDVAWVVGVKWQGQGIATEAASAMCEWLASHGVERFTAHIHPEHAASGRVAAAVGLQPTDEVDSDGEVVWASPLARIFPRKEDARSSSPLTSTFEKPQRAGT